MSFSVRALARNALYIVTVLSTILAFQNCADSLPSEVSSNTAQSLDPDGDSDPLTIIAPATMLMTTKVPISAKGGTPPYVFSVAGGPGSIVINDSLVAASSAGLIILEVADADGSTAQTGVQVTADPTKACVTAWGDPVPPNGTVVAFKAAKGSCAAACERETQTCIGGMMTGTFTKKSCAYSCQRWVRVASSTEAHAAACDRFKLKPAIPSATLDFGICASSENRPKKGIDYDLIKYPAGTSSTSKVGGTKLVKNATVWECYNANQKQDHDGTDRVLAYLCVNK